MNIIRMQSCAMLVCTLIFYCSCGPHFACYDEDELKINFFSPVQEPDEKRFYSVDKDEIDTIPYKAFAVTGKITKPLNNLITIPLHLEMKEITVIYESPTRNDTLIFKYQMEVDHCSNKRSSQLHIKLTSLELIKNTFNESNPHIHIDYSIAARSDF